MTTLTRFRFHSFLTLPFATVLAAAAKGAPVPEDAVSPHFEIVAKHLDLGGVFFAYADIEGNIDSFADDISNLLKTQGAPPELSRLDFGEIFNTLGISQISAVGLSSYQRGKRFHNKAFVQIPGGRVGLFKGLGGTPTPFLSRQLAPAGADLIVEHDLDLKSTATTIQALIEAVGAGSAVDQWPQMMEERVGPVRIGDLIGRGPTKLTIIGQIDRDRRLKLPDATEVAEFDLLIALDGFAWLLPRLKSGIPPDALAQFYEDGDSFESVTAPAGPPPFEGYRPLLYVADGDSRLYIATRRSFLDRCLAADGAILENGDYKKAMAGLPTEGNSLFYVSPDITSEISRLVEASEGKMGAAELAVMQMLGGNLTAELEYGVGHVSANLPEGILWASNSISSHKSTSITALISPIAILASFAVPVFNKTIESAQNTKNINNAKQYLLALLIHASDHHGKFPETLGGIGEDYLDEGVRKRLQWQEPGTGRAEQWLYYGKNLTNASRSDRMLLAAPRSTSGMRIVGFVDGSVQKLSESAFRKLSRKAKE